MGVSFDNTTMDELKSRINIVDVVGRVVQLKRAGVNYKGVCPFHNEKTPSFVVSEQKQIFTCFGCGATGDAIEFEKRYYNVDFNQAVDKLAGEYGITIKRSAASQDREKYYQINKEAARFFYNAFVSSKNPGYSYMKSRGIDDAILKKFGIGYADESWDSLYNYFKSKGVDEKVLLELGLISESKGKFYDKFRSRVIFPIINTNGKVIGFGGRAIGDAMPKYLNSPENRIFQKKNNLYGLNATKQDIGKEGYAILVEGYMDTISLYQGGVKNVIASLGTALTENQAKLIKRYTDKVVLSYDADGAGQNAAFRGIDILSKEECKVNVLRVTDGKDPDEFIKKNGRDKFLKLVEQSLPYVDFKLEFAKKNLNLNSEEGKLDYVKRASSIIKELSPVSADIYIKKVSKDIGIAEGAIKMEIAGNNNSSSNVFAPKRVSKEKKHVFLNHLEATLFKALLVSPALTEKLLDYEGIISGELGRKIWDIMVELYGLEGDFHLNLITDRLDPVDGEAFSAALKDIIICGNEEQVFQECVNTWKINALLAKEQDLIDRLSLADEKNNLDSIKELTVELMQVQKEINSYGGRK